MAIIIFTISVLLILGLGVFLIVGTVKGVPYLVEPPLEWYAFYPYYFLRKLGNKAIYYFHIIIGSVFVIGAVWIVIYFTYIY